MGVGILWLDLDDIFELDQRFVVLAFVKVCDGALAMLSLLGFGGLRAAAEGEDERQPDGDYGDRVARTHSPNLLLNPGCQDPLPCGRAGSLAMQRKEGVGNESRMAYLKCAQG